MYMKLVIENMETGRHIVFDRLSPWKYNKLATYFGSKPNILVICY